MASPTNPNHPLTKRELQVLKHPAEGKTSEQLARVMDISLHTVKYYVANILMKTGAKTRTEAVADSIRQGLI